MRAAGTNAPPPTRRIGIIATLLGLAVLVMIAMSTMRQSRVSCEVCVTYRGRTQCRAASATAREDAIRTATDNACTFLASGMAESIQCGATPPDSVTCEP